jgi:hypothetical protein
MKASSWSPSAYTLCLCAFVPLCLLGSIASAGEPAAAPGAGAVTVLSSDTLLRSHLVFKTPVMVGKDGQVKPVPDPNPKAAGPMAEFQSPLPPADWTKPDFNDSSWEKDRAPIEAGAEDDANRFAGPSNSLICVRAKFTVADPDKVQSLKLSLEYVGGVVVHVNGQELSRGHMPSGEVKPDTLAEKYPDDLYVQPDGNFAQIRAYKWSPEAQAAFAPRFRKMADVDVPAKLLRKGVNVLAVEVHRSAINEAILTAKRVRIDTGCGGVPGFWAYAGLKDLSLTAAAGSALSPNVERPKGIQVWNCAPYETVTAFSYGDGGEIQPIVVASPRNGVFSGRLAVSSYGPIKGLKIAVSDLADTGGKKIPPAAVQVRCAEAGISLPRENGKLVPFRYNALVDAIPAEVPVVKATSGDSSYPTNYMRIKYCPGPCFPVKRKGIVGGAVTPIWITVRVPKEAAPGSYGGKVTVSAEGLAAVTVPMNVVVSAWTLPDPKDFRIINFGQESPDSLARYYDVPMWSDRHFELIGRSMALMAELNSRQAIAELCTDFYGLAGNQDTMVRWIKQADGSFKYDFSVLDKYLDAAAKHMGKPALLRLTCWGELLPGWGGAPADPDECWKKVACGKKVSVLDPASGKQEFMDQPTPGTEASLQFWKPVLDEIRKKVEARGWWDVTAMGHNSYSAPAHPTVVGIVKKIWPDGVWSFTAHSGVLGDRWPTTVKGENMLARYADGVWTKGAATARGGRKLLQPRPGYWCYTYRTDFNDASGLTILRDIPEEEITCGHDGVSDFGVDFFAVKGQSGRMTHVGCGAGTGGPTDSTMALLAPGRDGPVVTERYEMLREGVEVGEAILYLERALQEKKVSGELADRVNRYLDGRDEAYRKRWPNGRFERDLALLALAGEVAAAVKSP